MAEQETNRTILSLNNALEFFGIRRNKEEEIKSISNINTNTPLKQHSEYELDHLPKPTDRDGKNALMDPSAIFQEAIKNAEDITDDNSILRLLNPEIDLAESILVGSIMSPNDLQTGSVLCSCNIPGLEPSIQGELNEYLNTHFNDTLNFGVKLERYVANALFGSGATPIITVPKVNIDLLNKRADLYEYASTGDASALSHLNSSTEALLQTDTATVDMVQDFDGLYAALDVSIESIKDVNKRKVAKTKRTKMATRTYDNVKDYMKASGDLFSIENDPSKITSQKSINKNAILQLQNKLDKSFIQLDTTDQGTTRAPMMVLSDDTTEEGDYAAIVELPSSAVIPVCIPGSTSEHIGYYVMADAWGTPISPDKIKRGDAQTNNSYVQKLLQASHGENHQDSLIGTFDTQQKFDIAAAAFGVTVSQMLNKNCANLGLDGVKVESHNAISNCLLYHMINKQELRMIFVPSTLMTYYAFDYRDSGMGKSLIEGLSYLLSLRTTILLAETMAVLREAIDHKTISVAIADNDQNIEGTINTIRELYLSKKYPKFSNNPTTAIREIVGNSVSVVPTNIPGFDHTMEINTDRGTASVARPDTDLKDTLTSMISLGFDVPPGAIDRMKEDELAISVATNNLHFTNAVKGKQRIATKHATHQAKNIIKYSANVRNDICNIVKDTNIDEDSVDNDTNKDQKVINLVMKHFKIELPSPNMSVTKAQMEEMTSYMDMVEKVAEHTYSDDLLGIDDREAEETIKAIRASVVSDSVKQFISSNGMAHLLDIPDATDFDSRPVRDFALMCRNMAKGMSNLKKKMELDEDEGGSSSGSGW